MKIQQNISYNDRTKYKKSFKGVPSNPKYIPEFIGNIGKVVGQYVNAPEQKLFLATTALMFQPLIDLKFAQEDKKIDSAIKSASKAIAGGLTGVSIRALAIAFAEKTIGINNHNLMTYHFLPDKIEKMYLNDPEMAQLKLKQYNKTIGTLFAVLVMIGFTNSKVDVPLTSDLQDFLSGIIKDKKSWTKSLSDVITNRKNKIKSYFTKHKDAYKTLTTKLGIAKNVLFTQKSDSVEVKNK